MADTFLSDTEAPSLGLYLVRVPSGIAYEVKRASDDEFLFCGNRVQVRLFLRGYAAAQAPADTCIGCCEKFERENMVDSAWLYGLVCEGCAESVVDDIAAALTARQVNIAPGGRS